MSVIDQPMPRLCATADAITFHVFLPWSVALIGYPLIGAKSLCGVTMTGQGAQQTVGEDHPGACHVCADLLAYWRERLR